MRKTQEKIDILNRQPIIEQLQKLIDTLDCKSTNRSFAINGQWGCGKSFILDMLEDEINKSKTTIFIRFNAWEYDFYEEPLIAILSCIVDKLNELLKIEHFTHEIFKTCINNLSNLLGSITKFTIGVNVVKEAKEIVKKLKKTKEDGKIKNDFDNNQVLKNTINTIQKNLQDIDCKIVFVVDEIDRCLPDYAIKVLERTHHVFNNLKQSITIFSVDKKQLKHLVENYYGSQLNIDNYMEKFIEFTYDISVGSFNEKFSHLFKSYLNNFDIPDDNFLIAFQEYLQYLMQYLDIRKRIQIIKRAELLHNLTINCKCDLSIAYFEMICLVVFDIYKEQSRNCLINFITPSSTHADAHANNCLLKIFKDVKTYQYRSTNPKIDDAINISSLNDINSIVFLYIRKISKCDIFCGTGLTDKKQTEQIIEQLKLNTERIKTFYDNLKIIK